MKDVLTAGGQWLGRRDGRPGRTLPGMERDPEAERALVARLGALRPGAADELNEFADSRVQPGPVDMGTDLAPRDLDVDALEELADCRNYLVWRYAERKAQGAGVAELAVRELAIRRLVTLWRLVRQAQQ